MKENATNMRYVSQREKVIHKKQNFIHSRTHDLDPNMHI